MAIALAATFWQTQSFVTPPLLAPRLSGALPASAKLERPTTRGSAPLLALVAVSVALLRPKPKHRQVLRAMPVAVTLTSGGAEHRAVSAQGGEAQGRYGQPRRAEQRGGRAPGGPGGRRAAGAQGMLQYEPRR